MLKYSYGVQWLNDSERILKAAENVFMASD
jgi:hypothetical protein